MTTSKCNLQLLLIGCLLVFVACSREDPEQQPSERNYKMGFTTWAYDATIAAVDETYAFIGQNGDIYAEHLDNRIPWSAWINDDQLPPEFLIEVLGRSARRIPEKELLLSVGLLNLDRDDLADDFDGETPAYTQLDDPHIEEAYTKHVNYLLEAFEPNYLVITIEANELKENSPDKWEAYKRLISRVKMRIKTAYPDLAISESVSFHNVYNPNQDEPDAEIQETLDYMNELDFAAISYYPFLNGLSNQSDIQGMFDFLHEYVNQPIAFVENAQIAEDLVIPNFNLSIRGSQDDQEAYLQTLLTNAQTQRL
jgi:hypothetical protein